MLSFHMFAATQPRRSLDSLSGSIPAPRPLTPNFLICHTSENALLSPTIATLPKMSLSKPSVCHIYDTAGGLGLAARSDFQTCERSNMSSVYPPYFHTLAHSFALFCILQKLNPFIFKRFRTLCKKTRGGGVGELPAITLEQRP